MMDWKATALDPEKEGVWKRTMRWHLLLFGSYFIGFLLLYWWWGLLYPEPERFFYHQLRLSRFFLVTLGGHLGLSIVLHRRLWAYRTKCFFFESGSPYTVAMMRILLCSVIFTHFIFYVPQYWSPLAALPHAARQPLPFVGWLIDILPISPTLYNIALALGILLSGMATLGIFTRMSLIMLIPLVFYLFGVPQFYGKLSHYQFFFWITVILAFAPNYHVWSLDGIFARIRGIRISKQPDLAHGLVLRAITLTLAGVYFFSGFRKLYEVGFFWALSDNPVNLLRTEWLEQFNDVPWVRVDQWPLLCNVAALGVILFELAYPLMILTPRGRRAAAWEAVLFHNLNGYFLKIDFTYLKTAHLSYFSVERWVKWFRQRQRRWLAWLLLILAVMNLGIFVGASQIIPGLLVWAVVDIVWNRSPRIQRGRWLLRLRKKFPLRPSTAFRKLSAARWLRVSVATSAVLITLNWTCGAFGIHSWPFSAYPTYSFLRGSTVKYGWFIPVTAQGTTLDLDQEAKAIKFRKENILPMAERIVTALEYEPGKANEAILQCWLRWRTEVPILQTATSAQVVIREYPLDPDSHGKLIAETHLGEMQLIKGEWRYLSDSLIQKLQVPK
ncbi:MAG: hypothetical protein IPP17_06855 [Bacteroidetes bacterium]|nr:hypothetical protein [Bacteroidota bacterium]